MIILIPKKLESLNKVLRWHWGRRKKEKEEWSAWLLTKKKDLWGVKKRVFKKLTIISHRKRLLDPDNLWGAAKLCIDAVKEMGLIRDDNTKSCKINVLQDLGDEGTEIRLE